ncbi:hypothetical protein OIDMADRAFT_17552 [Oidiodendron maius Zn]|uniref:Uncharacterized protein n=1 Tax=Oidiodendron maius (strain Zn) TaxID=913774 RepID=A0A0C3CZR6_OIDMZ|nr:hypothetical protein OIDMADRAFT_17552 [Oidiodendron maius Zn]
MKGSAGLAEDRGRERPQRFWSFLIAICHCSSIIQGLVISGVRDRRQLRANAEARNEERQKEVKGLRRREQ